MRRRATAIGVVSEVSGRHNRLASHCQTNMPPKRANVASKAVEDERDGGGASAKRKSGFIPRKIVRGEVESGPTVPPSSAGPAAAAVTGVGATTASVAAIATTAAISTTPSKALSASSSSSRSATAAGQRPSVSNAPAVEFGLLPAKRTRVASMKARELAERKRSGALDRSSDESGDEAYVKGNGDNDVDYNSPGRRRLSAGKRGRGRRSATAARVTENDYDDSDEEADKVAVSKSKRIVKKTPKRSLGSPLKQRVEAAVATTTRSAVSPATDTTSPHQPKSLVNQPSDPLPVTVAVIIASESDAGGAVDRLPATLSSPIGIVRTPPASTAGSASLPSAVQSPPNVVPDADAAAPSAALPAVPSEPASECEALSSAAQPTAASAAAAPLDAVPLVVAEAADGFQLSTSTGEAAGAVAGILMDQVGYPSQDVQECDVKVNDGVTHPSAAEEHESEQPSQPVTVAALNDDNHPGDQGTQARLNESNPAESAVDNAALTSSVAKMLSASGELSSVTAAQVLSALSAFGSRPDGGIGEAVSAGAGSGRRAGVKKDGRSASGSAVSAAKLADAAAAAAAVVGDRAQSAKPKTVECSTCHKLVRRYDLNKHIKNVHSGDKPNKCPHCDYASPWKGNLNTHIAGVHLKARSHECSQCKLLFKTRGAMIGHVRKVHDRMYQPTERNFECEECHKKFFKKFHLQRHERVHTGEKPFLCVFCEKKFTSKTNMDTHIQSVHLKIKPFRCGYCEKGFGRKKLMVMHVRKYHINNAPIGELSDDEDDVDDVDDGDDEELSDGGQAPSAPEGAAALLSNIVQNSAAASSSSLAVSTAAATASGVSAAATGSSSSASATATQAGTRVMYLRMPDVKETAAQLAKQYVVIRQEQAHGGAGDVAADHRAGASTAASMDGAFTIAVDGNSSGHSANSSSAIVWQPATAAAGDGAEGAIGLQQQHSVRQQQQLNTSANIVWQFEQMPAGSVLQAVQASDGTVILLATPASPTALAAVAGGHQQLAVVPSADGTPDTILAVETVAVNADSLLAARDRETAQQHFPSDGSTA